MPVDTADEFNSCSSAQLNACHPNGFTDSGVVRMGPVRTGTAPETIHRIRYPCRGNLNVIDGLVTDDISFPRMAMNAFGLLRGAELASL